ncbi:MAG TPA: hypothetical protein VLB73_03550 [Patescibacteria group bacterium]|nr:hypothetical protein [Patescibacteria group bacterium]
MPKRQRSEEQIFDPRDVEKAAGHFGFFARQRLTRAARKAGGVGRLTVVETPRGQHDVWTTTVEEGRHKGQPAVYAVMRPRHPRHS